MSTSVPEDGGCEPFTTLVFHMIVSTNAVRRSGFRMITSSSDVGAFEFSCMLGSTAMTTGSSGVYPRDEWFEAGFVCSFTQGSVVSTSDADGACTRDVRRFKSACTSSLHPDGIGPRHGSRVPFAQDAVVLTPGSGAVRSKDVRRITFAIVVSDNTCAFTPALTGNLAQQGPSFLSCGIWRS